MNTSRNIRYSAILLMLAALACTNPAVSPAVIPPATIPASTPLATLNLDQVKAELDTSVPASIQASEGTGCSLALVSPDSSGTPQTSFFNYGTLSKESQTSVASSTEYEIGSLSKLLTADLLAYYVENGSMKLDDPLQNYLPANAHVPTFNGQVITLRQLATHTSGLPLTLPETPPAKINGVQVSGYVTNEEIFNFLNSYQLTRAPGSQWEYSNLANAILGIAEEQVGKDTYENLALKNIIEPLGLNQTYATLPTQAKANLAKGYGPKGNAPPFAESGEMLAAGGLRSNAQDQGLYLIANMNPTQTNLTSILQMTLQVQDKGSGPGGAMGLGWKIANVDTPQQQFNKAGSTAGYNSYIAFWPRTKIGYALLCNGHPVSDLTPKINKLLGGSDAPVDGSE